MARIVVVVLLGVLLPLGCAETVSESPATNRPVPAEVVLTGGMVVTSNGSAEAIAVAGELIVAVDTAAAVADFIGDDTVVVDLDGRVVPAGLSRYARAPDLRRCHVLGCGLHELSNRAGR